MIRDRIIAGVHKCKDKARWIWRHRTKATGSLGIAVGALERFADSHPLWHFPGRGYLLMGFGAVVAAIGGYNTLAEVFGWQDDPT